MTRLRVHRRTALIVVLYASALTALMSFFALNGYTPLVFYTPILWIVLPVMVYAWLRNRRRRREDDEFWRESPRQER